MKLVKEYKVEGQHHQVFDAFFNAGFKEYFKDTAEARNQNFIKHSSTCHIQVRSATPVKFC